MGFSVFLCRIWANGFNMKMNSFFFLEQLNCIWLLCKVVKWAPCHQGESKQRCPSYCRAETLEIEFGSYSCELMNLFAKLCVYARGYFSGVWIPSKIRNPCPSELAIAELAWRWCNHTAPVGYLEIKTKGSKIIGLRLHCHLVIKQGWERNRIIGLFTISWSPSLCTGVEYWILFNYYSYNCETLRC